MLSQLPNFLKLHQFDLHVPQTVLLTFAISPNQKGVCGGISRIIQLCIDDINLHSSWVPAPKGIGPLLIRYYCIKKHHKIIGTFTADSLSLQKIGNLKAVSTFNRKFITNLTCSRRLQGNSSKQLYMHVHSYRRERTIVAFHLIF